MRFALPAASILLAAIAATPLAAQNREVPYWASINTEELNMRVGPATTYKIDWVYTRKGWPVRVLRTRQGWRYVEDADGTRGWFLGRFLTRERHAVVVGDGLAEIRAEPAASAPLNWNAEPGVVGKLGECSANWCEFDVGGRVGWIAADRIWGEGEP